MAKPRPEFRADHLVCPLNAVKLAQVVNLVETLRECATREAAWQWEQFYKNRYGAGFVSVAKKGWTRPWVKNKTLTTSYAQMVMNQVAGSLKGYFGNVTNTYTELVSGCGLPEHLRHQLHSIKYQQAWFFSRRCSCQASRSEAAWLKARFGPGFTRHPRTGQMSHSAGHVLPP